MPNVSIRRMGPAALACAAALGGFWVGRHGLTWTWLASLAVLGMAWAAYRRGRALERTRREASHPSFRPAPDQGPMTVGRLAAGVAHDYNNLLTAILGYSDVLLARMSDEDPNRMFVEEIRKAGERASQSTERLVTLSRMPPDAREWAEAFGAPKSVPAETPAAPAGDPDGVAGRETILVVEDEEGARNLARNVLEAEGYTVLEASGAREAMYMHENHAGRIDVLLTDMVLSGRTGREIARDLMELRPGIRVIFMSGYPVDDLIRAELEKNQSRFLAKPFPADRLAKIVREVLDRPPVSAAAPAPEIVR